MRWSIVSLLVLGALLSSSRRASALELVPARTMVLKDGKLSKIVSKPPKGETFALPPSTPGSIGMVWCAGNSENCEFVPLTDSGWKPLGNPPGSKGYKYSANYQGVYRCKVLLKETIIKASCKDSTVLDTGSPATPYGAAWSLIVAGQTYCAQVNDATGGIVVKDEPDYWKAIGADAPEACPPMNPD